MGYTTYFEQNRSFTEVEWNELTRILPLIITESGVTICDGHGDPESTPVIDDNEIAFNGCDDYSHETFYITKALYPEFNFCKTACKPYDIVVCAFLTVINEIAPDALKISSDGNSEDWSTGVLLASKVMGKDMICPVP